MVNETDAFEKHGKNEGRAFYFEALQPGKRQYIQHFLLFMHKPAVETPACRNIAPSVALQHDKTAV